MKIPISNFTPGQKFERLLCKVPMELMASLLIVLVLVFNLKYKKLFQKLSSKEGVLSRLNSHMKVSGLVCIPAAFRVDKTTVGGGDSHRLAVQSRNSCHLLCRFDSIFPLQSNR